MELQTASSVVDPSVPLGTSADAKSGASVQRPAQGSALRAEPHEQEKVSGIVVTFEHLGYSVPKRREKRSLDQAPARVCSRLCHPPEELFLIKVARRPHHPV
eukprot:scaffold3759_cov425-Prasinococcus_capsulatus_cf.AAC.12